MEEYFQDVNDVYSELTHLEICITDLEGNQITKSNKNPSIFELFGKEDSKNMAVKFIRNFPKVNEPVVYDCLPGVKIIICPIYLEKDINFFTFAGCFLEYSTKLSVQTYLKRALKSQEKVSLLLSLLPEYNSDQIKDKTKKIKKMSEILSYQLSTQKLNLDLKMQNKINSEVFQLVAEDNLKVYDLLKRFRDINKVDFVGYARRVSPVQFQVKECFPNDSQLKEKVFSIGEGILGQVAATNTGKFWDEAKWYPRNAFFHKNGIFPRSIFCFPITHDHDILGLFFGGSTELDNLERELSLNVELTTSLITVIENKLYWQGKAMYNHVKTTLLNDLFQAMTSLKDIKSVQMFLLEMSKSLKLIPFVSVVTLQQSSKPIDILSSGLSEEEIKEYTDEIVKRYLNNKDVEQQTTKEVIRRLTKCGAKVLEIPMVNHDLYGFLCIGLSDDIKEDEVSLFKILANAGAVALKLLKASNKIDIEQTMLDTLIGLFEFNDPEHLKNATEARKVINEFGAYIAWPQINITALQYSFYFLGYGEQLLNKVKDESIIDILREYKLVADNSLILSDASINVQMLTLIWTYINEKNNINSLAEIKGINKDLLNKFILYLSRSDTKISTTFIKDDPFAISEILSTNKLTLTNRETEILELVLNGKGNREIAETLYISEHTVKNHMTNIFNKLNVNDRTQAITKIYQMGYQPKNAY